MRKQLGAVIVAGGLLLSTAAIAHAEQISFDDVVGDTRAPGLDIVMASIRNRDRVVVAEVTFRNDRRGIVSIGITRRDTPWAAMETKHLLNGPDSNYIQIGSTGNVRSVECSGLTSDWNRRKAVLRMHMPSKCLNRGDYGAIKTYVLAERWEQEKTNTAFAPRSKTRTAPFRFSRWIARSSPRDAFDGSWKWRFGKWWPPFGRGTLATVTGHGRLIESSAGSISSRDHALRLRQVACNRTWPLARVVRRPLLRSATALSGQ